MREISLPARRFVSLAALAAIATAVLIGGFGATAPATSMSIKCPAGEAEDVFTGVCLPEPSPSVVEMTTQEFDAQPEIDGVPCTGHNSYECIGLGEEQLAQGPAPSAAPTGTSSP